VASFKKEHSTWKAEKVSVWRRGHIFQHTDSRSYVSKTQPAKPLMWLGQELYGHHTDHWLHCKWIGLYGSRAADPIILQPSTNKISGKDLYRTSSYIMCHYAIKTWTLITARCTTGLVRAEEETQPHGWQRTEVAAKVTNKNGYISQSSTFPMLQAHIFVQ